MKKVLVFDPSGSLKPYIEHFIAGFCDEIDGVLCGPKSVDLPQNWISLDFFPAAIAESRLGFAKLLKIIIYPLALYRLHRYIKKNGVEVVHLQWVDLPLWWYVYFKFATVGFLKVITVHNSEFGHGVKTYKLRLQSLGYTSLVSAADAVICHISIARDRLVASGIQTEKIHVIPHAPIELTTTQTLSEGCLSLKFDFAHVGILSTYKGSDVFLRSIDRLNELLSDANYPDVVNILVAGRPERDVEALASTMGAGYLSHVRLTLDLGYLTDSAFASALTSTRYLVLPYRSIDASGILNAAISHSIPSIVSDLKEFRATLGDAAASYVRPEDHEQLAAAMFQSVGDLNTWHANVRAMKAVSKASVSWAEVSGRTLKVYG